MRRTSRIVARGLLMAVVTHLGVPGDSDAQTLGEAIAQLRSGSYDEALSALREIALGDESDSGRSAAYVAYMAALAEVGRYDDALDMGTEAPGGMSVAVANTLGEILYQVGRVEEAREAFARSIDGSAGDRHSAQLNQAIAEWDYGDREVALADFDTFIDIYNGAETLSSEDLVAVATAVR